MSAPEPEAELVALAPKERDFLSVIARLGGGWWRLRDLRDLVDGDLRRLLNRLTERGFLEEESQGLRATYPVWRLSQLATDVLALYQEEQAQLCADCREQLGRLEREPIGRHTRGAFVDKLLPVGGAIHTMTIGGHTSRCQLRVVARLKVLRIEATKKCYWSPDDGGWLTGYPVQGVWERVYAQGSGGGVACG